MIFVVKAKSTKRNNYFYVSNTDLPKVLVIILIILFIGFFNVGSFIVLVPFVISLILLLLVAFFIDGYFFQGKKYLLSLLIASNIMSLAVPALLIVGTFGTEMNPASTLILALVLNPFILLLPIISIINILCIISYVRKIKLTKKVYVFSVIAIALSCIAFYYTVPELLATVWYRFHFYR